MPYIQYQGHDLYYEGSGSGAPLLLLHGNTASSRMFAQVAQAYARDFRVLLMDFSGCGRSERLALWPEDLWYDEGLQAACLLDTLGYTNVNVIGASGGALAAFNLALERPELVGKLIADSFEGEHALADVTQSLRVGREASKQDAGARMFYQAMNGADWEQVVDADTQAVLSHAEHIGAFFHKPLSALKAKVLLTGSREDEFCPENFFATLFPTLLQEIGHGEMHIFEHGGHPAMLSNQEAFLTLSRAFLNGRAK